MGLFVLVITLYIAIYGGMTWMVLTSLVRVLALRGIAVWVCNIWGALMVLLPFCSVDGMGWDTANFAISRRGLLMCGWVLSFLPFAFCCFFLFFAFFFGAEGLR